MNRVGFHSTHETQATKMIFLDSVDCRQSTQLTSHYSYAFKDAIETARGEAMLVSLSSASIPYSFYNIRTGINDLLHYQKGGVTQDPLAVTPGNYSATALGKEIVGMFGALSPTPIPLVMSYDKTTLKFKFSSSSNLTFVFDEERSIKDEIGFSETTVISIDAANPTPSGHAADLNGSVHAIYVRTNLATKSVMESQSGGVSDILAKIDINTDPGGVITLDPNQVSHESLIHTAGIKHVEIRLTDERNRLLDLNGLHSQLALRFRFVDTKVSPALTEIDPRQRVNPKDAPQLKQRRTPDPTKKKKR